MENSSNRSKLPAHVYMNRYSTAFVKEHFGIENTTYYTSRSDNYNKFFNQKMYGAERKQKLCKLVNLPETEIDWGL